MHQSQFLAITCTSLEAREKSRVHGTIGLAFASHWLKIWRESFKPITKRSNYSHVITFDSHLKTALSSNYISWCFQNHFLLWCFLSCLLSGMELWKTLQQTSRQEVILHRFFSWPCVGLHFSRARISAWHARVSLWRDYFFSRLGSSTYLIVSFLGRSISDRP